MNLAAQTVTLRDGRTLGYAEWGDLNGKPVFYFTSPEASRYSRHPDETILTELGVHLYTFDRPGRGLSTPHPDRRLLDWADDMRDFVQQKNIGCFAMLGHSQGGVHCLACAYALPEWVSSITVVTTVAGLDHAEVMATQSRQFRAQVFMSRHTPWLMTLQWNFLRLVLKGKLGEQLLLMGLRGLPERDQATVKIPGASAVMFQSLREGLRQGGASVTHDFRLVANDCGFKLEAVQSQVFIWHGEADPLITPSTSHYLAAHLPNNEAKFIPEEGNLLIYSHWR